MIDDDVDKKIYLSLSLYPGILNFAPLVEVPAAILPVVSRANIPMVSWLAGPQSTL